MPYVMTVQVQFEVRKSLEPHCFRRLVYLPSCQFPKERQTALPNPADNFASELHAPELVLEFGVHRPGDGGLDPLSI